MHRRKVVFLVAVVAAVTLSLVVAFTTIYPPVDENTLIWKLRLAGMNVTPNGEIDSGMFSVKAHSLLVDGATLEVFVYNNVGEARNDSARISSDGYTVYLPKIGNYSREIKLGWISPPHFYQSGRIIVVYAGSNTKITQTLERVMGRQFAGS